MGAAAGPFLLIPETEWHAVLIRLARLEQKTEPMPAATADPDDSILNVREAAAHLGMTAEGVRKARRAKRLTGVRLNEKSWGFRRSELTRYQNRYSRPSK